MNPITVEQADVFTTPSHGELDQNPWCNVTIEISPMFSCLLYSNSFARVTVINDGLLDIATLFMPLELQRDTLRAATNIKQRPI